MARTALALVGALLLGGVTADAAGQESDVVDRVVAVVGHRPILQSQVDEQLFIRFPQGQGLPDTPEGLQAVRRDVLQELIHSELLLQRAEADTNVKVSEEDVTASVDELVRSTRGRYTSDADFRRDLRTAGFQTPEEWRSWLFDEQRKQLIVEEFRGQLRSRQLLTTVNPTDAEMRAWFEQNRGEQKRPENVTLRQLVVAPVANAAAKARALATADSIARELRAGADFATAARRFSQDPGSREQGGSLNWFRRGVMHPAFERVAFGFKPGVISDPVETPFGYHIIQVQRVQAAEVQARHILIMPEVGAPEADSAKAKAERLLAALRAGASLDSLQVAHHDPAETKELPRFPLDRLPPDYRTAIEGVEVGQYAEIFALESPEPNRTKWVVLRLDGRDASGELRFEDGKDEVRRRLTEIMTMERYLGRLRDATYVEVKEL